MSAVATIIRRHLLASRAILLPEMGTLEVVEHGAQFTDAGRRMAPAVKELSISNRDEMSIIDYITWDTDADESQATTLYNQWLDDVVEGENLTIDGVCRISLTNYKIETFEEFWHLANPTANERIVVNTISLQTVVAPLRPVPQKRGNATMIIAILCVVIATAYLLYYFRDPIMTLIK